MRAGDVKFLNLVLKGCAFKAEPLSSSTLTRYPSRSGSKSIDNYLPLSFFECRCTWSDCSYGCSLQLRARDIQFITLAENHATFNKILKFANIAWPISGHQSLHC